MTKVDIDRIIQILKKETRKFNITTLNEISFSNDPFKVLISCLLSLRTKDAVTLVASKRLFAAAQTAEKLSKLPLERIRKLIYPVGFYITKAERIRNISKELVEKYHSKVPDTIEELIKFHGVGRKTANIVVTVAYKKHGVAVDTHVHRISNRLGYVKTKTPEQTEYALRAKLPRKYWLAYNDLLVTWGQNVCAPVSPKCSMCAIREYCNRVGITTSR
jgi:endonuclease-3